MADDEESISIRLERLRSTCAEGFARIDGQLAVIASRSDRTEKDIEDLQARISTLERRVWKAVGAAMVLAALFGFLPTLVQITHK